MIMLTATKEVSWAMAHMLANHEGLCKNLHGHNYTLQVTVRIKETKGITKAVASAGMVIDFKDLSRVLKEIVLEPLDHAFMYNIASTDKAENQIADVLQMTHKKIATVPYRPTAENMALDFKDRLNTAFEVRNLNIVVHSLTLWETETSFTTVTE